MRQIKLLYKGKLLSDTYTLEIVEIEAVTVDIIDTHTGKSVDNIIIEKGTELQSVLAMRGGAA